MGTLPRPGTVKPHLTNTTQHHAEGIRTDQASQSQRRAGRPLRRQERREALPARRGEGALGSHQGEQTAGKSGFLVTYFVLPLFLARQLTAATAVFVCRGNHYCQLPVVTVLLYRTPRTSSTLCRTRR